MKNINQKIINLSEEKRALLKIKLKNKTSSKCKTIPPRENRDSVPLSFAQQRLWFLEQLEPNSPFYNIAKAACLTGEINILVLREALEAIVVHHEILRTNYIAENGNPIQVIAAPQAVELQIIDLQQYGQAEQENQVQKLLQQEIQRPFNLASDLMLRGCLLKLAPQEHVLLLVMHHIASDGWSMGILWQQLTQLYQALLDGQPNPLETLPIQYADYAVWQREWLSGEVLDQQLNYWKKQLAGANPLLELPTDHPRPAVQTYRGASQSLLLPQSLSDGLKELCRQEGVTLYMTLLAAFQTLLYRYSRQDDIIVGSPIAGRNRTELEGLIGFFVNTLVLRTDLSGNPSFQELLGRVRSITLDAYSHQDLPFEKLVEELNPERSLSYSPLFQVMFVLQNTPGQTGQLLGSTETPVQLQAETAKFDLTLSVLEKDGTLVSLWNYNTDLFDADTIERMTAHFQTLLEAIVDNPQQPIAQLPLLTKAERQQLLREWNDTEAEYPQKSVHQLFEEQVERTPDAVAVVFEEQQLTYRELNSRANQLAHYLQKLGVKPDVLVGLCVERSLEMIVGMLGILKAGGAYVPIDPDYPQERLAFILEDTQASVLLTQEKWLQRLPNDQLNVICLDSESEEIAQNSQDAPVCEATPDSLIYIIYTSGSTGKPKGVMIPHRGICNMLYWKQSNFKLSTTDKVLQTLPFSFDGSVCQIFWPLCFGGQLVLACPDGHKDPAYLVKTINEQQITIIGLVPSILRFLLEEKGIEHCQSLKHAVCGAEPLGLELVERFRKRLNLDNVLQNEYGPTEASMITSYWVCQGENNYTIAPIGRPIDNFQVYVLDEYLQPVPIGQPGELHIAGVGLARGYLNRPELTAEKFIPNPFSKEIGASLYKTGDSVRYLPDGNIEFLGRIDSQVKIRGFRIELGEIEAVLAQHHDIDETVVITREDIPGNQSLVAYIVPQQEQPHSSRDLRSFVQEHLPNYMVPSAFVFLDAMPLTPSGKVDRRALPAPDASNWIFDAEFIPPSNPTEEILATIWADVLGIELIGIHDNFFELGGHSLLATQVISRCHQAFSAEIRLHSLFENPTIARLAQTITQAENQGANLSQYQTISPRGKRDSAPLSFAQQRLWFLAQLEPNSPFYNIPKAVRLSGDLNVQILQQALDAIVAHHEILHTNYIAENRNPIQVIAAPQAVELQIIDLQQYGQAEQENQVQKLLKQESQRPFNLASDMMLRGCLLKLAPQEHILLLVMHHIASDGWSGGILWEQLTQTYQAFLDGQPNPLETLPIQYAEYAVWQREWLSGEVLDQQLSYWKKQLTGAKPLLELPTDRPRPAVQTYRGASQSFILPQSLSDGLKQLGRQEGVTLYMTLLAAFQTLLYRYSRQEDIIVGSPIAGRTRTELEGLIGFFVNTLVLRTDLSGNPSFQELLGRVRSITLDAYSHQDLPFEKLVEELNPERSLSHSPLFQVMFVLQNAPGQARQLLGLTENPVELEAETAKFDLLLSVTEKDGLIVGSWNYNTDLFDAATMTRMMAHFQTLLEGIVDNPQQPIAQLPLLTPAERQQLLVEWNDTATEYPQKCIHQLFEKQVERTPNAVAVVFEGQQLTYRELNNGANQLAHYLRKLGVGPDIVVGLCVERSLEMMVGLLGILKAGGAYLPLDPAYPEERLHFMLQDTQAPVLLTSKNLVTRLPEYDAQVVYLDKYWDVIAQESQENLIPGVNLENLGYVIYTSGSTGKPKGVTMTQLALCNLIWWQLQNTKVSSQAKTLQFSPISFDVSFQEIFSTWSSGGTLVLISEELRRDARALLKLLRKQTIERLFLPFVALQQLAEVAESTGLVPENLQEIITAGEQLQITPAISYLFSKLNNAKLYNHYGPSESHVVTAFSLNASVKIWSPLPPIGRPIANTQIYILDPHLQPVPIGVPGELYIGGFCLARGYLNRPELTTEKFVPNPFSNEEGERLYKTGDLARYLEDSNIEYLGRIDNQVKIRGFRIEIGEIEAVLAQYPAISEITVIAREDIPGDKQLVAYVVSQKEKPHSNDLRSFLKERLPNYMMPSAFVFLDTMPLTPSGKLDRRALPVPDTTRQESSIKFVAPPQDKLESRLIKIWEQVLGVQPIGVRDNFFDLGGHSLKAVTLFTQIEQEFGKNLPLATLFQSGTVAEIAQIIRQEEWLAPWESLVPIKPNGDKPPLFFIHPGGGNLLIYRDLADSLGSDQPVYGLQPRGLDGRYSPFHRIEDMAAFYLTEIRRIQPNGPYFLAGSSSGGIIAWEIAQILQDQGEKIAMLALFDTNGPDYFQLLPPLPRLLQILKWSGFNLLHRLNRLPKKLLSKLTELGIKQSSIRILQRLGIVKIVLTGDEKIQKDKMKTIFEKLLALYRINSSKISPLERLINFIAIFLLKNSSSMFTNVFVRSLCRDIINDTTEIPKGDISEIPGNDLSKVPEKLQKVQKANLNANRAYVPKAHSGRVVLFRASDRYPGFYDDPKFGWGDLAAGGMEIYEIPETSHSNIVKSPVLAEKLKICLEEAQANA